MQLGELLQLGKIQKTRVLATILQRVQIVQGVQNVSCNCTKACLYLHNAQRESARSIDFELPLHSIGISILIPNTFISYTLTSARRAKGGLQ